MTRPWRIGAIVLAATFVVPCTVRAVSPVRLRPWTSPLYADGEGVELKRPRGVACADGSVVVADSGGGRLVRYRVADESIRPVDVVTVRELPAPARVQGLEDGGMLVLDGRSHRIGRVGKDSTFGGFLSLDDGQDAVARSFRVGPGGAVFVLDVAGARIRIRSAEGTWTREIPFPDDAGFLSDLTVDSTGSVYVVDSVRRRVLVARPGDDTLEPLSEDLSEDLDFPSAIAVDDRGRIYLTDQNGGGVVILGRDGGFRGRQSGWGWKPGLLRYPSDLCVQGDLLAVADRENDRVQVFRVVE